MTNADVARILSNIATMLEIAGSNPFRIRAYREGARMVEEQAESIASIAAKEGGLEELPGIGKDLAQKIREIVATGTTPMYEELQKDIPLSVVAMTKLQGLGPKRVKTLFEELDIRTMDQLKKAAESEALRVLPGFGAGVEKKILSSLDVASRGQGRFLLPIAWPWAHALADHVSNVKGVNTVEIAGSFRRRKETIGDIDLLATGGKAEAVMKAFVSHPDVAEILGEGETKSSVRLRSDLQVDLRHVPKESFGAALVYFTGSKAHNIELRKIALDKGLSLNEYGLTRGKKLVPCPTEEDVYGKLDLPWIPPELREARGEIDLAREGRLPKLIELEDIVSDLHMHTDRTDGREDLETMVLAAKKRGYEYVAITDHSKSNVMMGGFDEARVKKSAKEIEAVGKKVRGIEVLNGLEVDILRNGSLDLDDDGLEVLDLVIVSLHSGLDDDEKKSTKRVLKALSHPSVQIMGHPTGRLIGKRAGAPFDMEKALDFAAERGIAMEINAQPNRQDLSDVNARLAKEKGVRISINTDAHSIPQLDNMKFGVFVARRAGLTKDDVLNTMPFAEFQKALRRSWKAGPSTAAAKRKTAARKKAAPRKKAAKR